ncbi:MAG TPA: patatin-like phospholipase family protein, partial [Xanthomonadales bacterium]|nr:patatin-like phospholipase family protein [Xanthomonadales bacterium]
MAQLSLECRTWLADQMHALALPGGATLFQAGDTPDALYVLLSGSLGAFAPGNDARVIGQVVAGETVGETGLLTASPRSATIRALRDCELLRLDRTAFDQLALREPAALVAMARIALARATAPSYAQRATTGPRTIAVLPQNEGVDGREFAETLGKALALYGSYVVVDAATGRTKDAGWFSRLEHDNQYVIYVADDGGESDWRRLTLRQADALLFVADAAGQPAPWSEFVRGIAAPLPRPEHLAVLHTGKPRLGAGRRWARHRSQARLHHIRSTSDIPRLARLVAGKSMSLVLSGGGARGFAHIGVIKALREAGIEIDAVGGTSIGAIIGAGIACDWPTEELVAEFHRSFVATNPLSDRTFPFVSMVSGRKVSRLLREAFGEREIEDLVLPYFCISSNLTDGRMAVHRSGPVWQWLRASVAIPGVLAPVFYRGQVYVDGGVINNLPVETMRESQRGEVIAVDIGGDHAVKVPPGVEEFDLPPLWKMVVQWYTGHRRPSIVEILLRAGMVNSTATSVASRNASTLLIQPNLLGIDLLNWQAFD